MSPDPAIMAGDAVMTGAANTAAPDQQASPAGPASPATDRHAAFAAGVPKMPRRVIYIAVAVILLVGLGGTLLSRFLASTTSAGTSTTSHSRTAAPSIRPAVPPNAKALSAPMPAFLGLAKLKAHPAPALSLTDARTGHQVSLAGLHGHVVVLTFANAACNDLCPVLASELHQADASLGSPPVPITFVTVNTDPLDLQTTHAAILSQATLASLSNWRFLTGSVHHLQPVWKRYGISIATEKTTTDMASHNDYLYVIDPNGKLAWRTTPFANESAKGTFSLPAAETARYARGIARVADYVAEGK